MGYGLLTSWGDCAPRELSQTQGGVLVSRAAHGQDLSLEKGLSCHVVTRELLESPPAQTQSLEGSLRDSFLILPEWDMLGGNVTCESHRRSLSTVRVPSVLLHKDCLRHLILVVKF